MRGENILIPCLSASGLARQILYFHTKKFQCVFGLPMCFCQTGEEYIVITNDMIDKQEGYPTPMGGEDTKEICAERLAGNLSQYLSGKTGTLYWRVEPEIEQDDQGKWRGYMRLAVSSNPQKWRTLEEYEEKEIIRNG